MGMMGIPNNNLNLKIKNHVGEKGKEEK